MERRSPFMSSAAKGRAAARARRRRARLRGLLLLMTIAVLLGLGVMVTTAGDGASTGSTASAGGPTSGATVPGTGQAALGPLPSVVDLEDRRDEVTVPFSRPPRAGLLVNIDTGNVLWRRNPTRVVPIASLTKMVTGLVAVDHLEPRDRIKITKSVLNYTGSGVGVLPKGKKVSA